MIQKIDIRAMQVDDIPAILEMEQNLFSVPWRAEMFLEEIKTDYAFVAVCGATNMIVGYICGLLLYDEFNITNVGVAQEFQRKGYAQTLLDYMIALLLQKKCFKFFLEVRESNLAAIRLYEKFGFEIAGKRKKYYNHPIEDALMMGLSFFKKPC